ncbi:hypothetical protein ASG31_01460 [Chryseobacterium sp. Leaf404]|uniref:hypothetical protein n=1 Tax=unclassified Chryseobacterium TaxID=2593645 RepID=UPI0006FAF438|nr:MULTISPECIES: hypothetical protein [unclassified Chryseobacterium]KQT22037.1 hypothetical protein ASG31_01460 [Chryseobacterium sp. Leaf404]
MILLFSRFSGLVFAHKEWIGTGKLYTLGSSLYIELSDVEKLQSIISKTIAHSQRVKIVSKFTKL